MIDIILEHREDASLVWTLQRSSPTNKKDLRWFLRERPNIGGPPCRCGEERYQKGLGNRDMIAVSGLDRNGKSSFPDVYTFVKNGNFADLIGKGLKTCPVRKPQKAHGRLQADYESICRAWDEVTASINGYVACYARSYYLPYLKIYEAFSDTVEKVRNIKARYSSKTSTRSSVNISAATSSRPLFPNRRNRFHFIDEFGHPPIQYNLFPLIENFLPEESFAVGDTAGHLFFREADYRIMKGCESVNPFPSASHGVKELGTNYRSLEKILRFNEKVFKEMILSNDEYRAAAAKSGLDNYTQKAKREEGRSGHVEVSLLEKNDENPPEREKVQRLIEELKKRGYLYRDIALSPRRMRTWSGRPAGLTKRVFPSSPSAASTSGGGGSPARSFPC
jgi:hypothetical protein